MKQNSRQAGLSELELRNGLKERLKSNEEVFGSVASWHYLNKFIHQKIGLRRMNSSDGS